MRAAFGPQSPSPGRRTAIVASIVIHLGLLLTLLATASGPPVPGREATVEAGAMTVSLVTLPRAASTPAAAAAALKVLTARNATSAPPVAAAPRGAPDPLEALAKRLRSPTAATPTEAPLSAAQPPPIVPRDAIQTAAANPVDAQSRSPGAGHRAGGAAADGLWGDIAPCWETTGARVTVPVSLEVVLDAHGKLAKAPAILRAGGGLDERRLAAEAAALQALGACLTRGDARFGGKTYRLDFPPS